jgi:hypothetical protein
MLSLVRQRALRKLLSRQTQQLARGLGRKANLTVTRGVVFGPGWFESQAAINEIEQSEL